MWELTSRLRETYKQTRTFQSTAMCRLCGKYSTGGGGGGVQIGPLSWWD